MGKALHIQFAQKRTFADKVAQSLPKGGNLNLCLTCGACASDEREDFCDELKDVWLPGKPGTPNPFAGPAKS